MLNFIQCHWSSQTCDKPPGIALRGCQYAGIIECEILPVRYRRLCGLDERGLAGLSRSINQHDPSVTERIDEIFGDVASKHAEIIRLGL